MIKLTRVALCKCSCRKYKGDNNKNYWYDYRNNTVYRTDCHKKSPIKATGLFLVDGTLLVNQMKLQN